MPAARPLKPVPTDLDILDASYVHVDHLVRMLEGRIEDHERRARFSTEQGEWYLARSQRDCADEDRRIIAILRGALQRDTCYWCGATFSDETPRSDVLLACCVFCERERDAERSQ